MCSMFISWHVQDQITDQSLAVTFRGTFSIVMDR